MFTIIHLPQDIISKIAAGEVIERPGYAVKEIVENAIDAKADVIEIHIEEAGLKRIQVIDNGVGMSREDLQICFLPHTTSKIKTEDELHNIKTLGFRGEALSSIAAVSQVKVQSRIKNSIGGTIITINHGKLEDISSIGMPVGTIITADNLFTNIPARKKFLKNTKTEFRHITDIVLHFALSHPSIHLVLTHNGKIIFDLPKTKNIHDRMNLIFGADLLQQFIPFQFEEGYIRIQGYIGKPQVASTQNQKQFIFINNRFVIDKIISLAVKESFGSLLPASTTPIFYFTILLPFEFVDVNVHPRKEQVSFVDQKIILDSIKQAVSATLQEHNITFNLAKFRIETSGKLAETTSFSGELLRKTVLPWDRIDTTELSLSSKTIQLHQTYIASFTKEGILLYDQHAVHERILFEEFKKVFEEQKKKKEIYQLAKPVTLHLSVTDGQILEEYKGIFTELGFSFEHFQGNTFILRSAPVVFKGRKLEKIVADVLTDLATDFGVKNIDIKTRAMLTYLSCRVAVKVGDILSEIQMKKLLQELEITPHNQTCPHGRPTKIIITLKELHTAFKRK